MYERRESFIQGCGGETRWRCRLEDLGVDEIIILKWIFKKWDWIALAQDRGRWRALVHTLMNLRVP